VNKEKTPCYLLPKANGKEIYGDNDLGLKKDSRGAKEISIRRYMDIMTTSK
jgi:hypothetical protein